MTSVDYLPLEGWDFQGTAWIDYYSSNEQAKDPGLELTQMRAVASKLLEGGDGIDVTLHHLRFPDIERWEFRPPTLAELVNGRNDRLAVHGWHWVDEHKRVHGRLGVWKDQDDQGGDLELGAEVNDLVRRNRAYATFFGSAGKFSSVLGGTLGYGESVGAGRWNAFYELGLNHQYGFAFDRDASQAARSGASASSRSRYPIIISSQVCSPK